MILLLGQEDDGEMIQKEGNVEGSFGGKKKIFGVVLWYGFVVVQQE